MEDTLRTSMPLSDAVPSRSPVTAPHLQNGGCPLDAVTVPLLGLLRGDLRGDGCSTAQWGLPARASMSLPSGEAGVQHRPGGACGVQRQPGSEGQFAGREHARMARHEQQEH
jgi:hypothetical protein